MRTELFIFIIFMFLSGSCRNETDNRKAPVKPGNREMTDLNRYLVQKDKEIIQNYIERKDLKMTESPTGLWYLIINEGNGQYLKDNDRIVMNYECGLLDGTVCYSSDDFGPKRVILGKTDIEPGLNEGLRLLKPGAEALFILPPFLAFGLVGDGKKIPPRTIIVYSVSILTEK
ncbi:MAG: FKBP-type peptidyl-prolyl cis-trans isomerase [Bacteroidia bacterium]|jgi:FKBP-type peptidyl-prolyl cis-trans isomerase|nr:FKBP-type peptidyl-prolyl cis-trans isomerase [Bacteroidia bacterium]